jgi:molybdenum-dependent DNA-binding transcriptional regulator ModE
MQADICERLRAAEMRRQIALRESKAATTDFRALLTEAGEELGTIAEAARQAGISRQSAYRILGRR